eukprot:549178-Amphidinium_carterae.1
MSVLSSLGGFLALAFRPCAWFAQSEPLLLELELLLPLSLPLRLRCLAGWSLALAEARDCAFGHGATMLAADEAAAEEDELAGFAFGFPFALVAAVLADSASSSTSDFTK